MTPPAAPAPIKSIPAPDRTGPSETALATVGSRAPKAVARSTSSFRSAPPPTGDGRHPIAWLHVTAPGHGAVPTATSKCRCGRDRSAVGHSKVLALIEDHHAHRTTCPRRRTGADETRKAA
ncbi:hypothetical protein [Streptomyces decoyicus]|uniref:hypothetical protein n=1 Tax=Streptomyces decoyicus TaxID=249567 RepID=UPI00380285B0